MVFVVHSVTWKALCKPVPCCRHKQQLQETLSCLSLMRAGTSPVPCRVRLASLHSWEKEIFVYCPGGRGQAAHRSVVHCYTSATAWSGLPHHVAGLFGALTPNWSFLPMDLGFRFGLLHKVALGIVLLSTAQMLRPLGSCWVTIGHGVLDGSVLFFFRPLYCFLVLMETPWGLPKKDQCLGKSKACTALPIAGFFSGHKDGVLDIGAL